jgi:aminocarboxymuconate-semialdehyde decarboxylase
MYYDTITHSEAALGYLISVMGVGNVLYGTDFPWDMGDYDSIPMIKELEGVKTGDKESILGKSSAKLFNVPE